MTPEQGIAMIRDQLPPLWYGIYQGCLQAGFDERQSFILTQTFIMRDGRYGVNTPSDMGPPNNNKE